jgi:hypothetical protein
MQNCLRYKFMIDWSICVLIDKYHNSVGSFLFLFGTFIFKMYWVNIEEYIETWLGKTKLKAIFNEVKTYYRMYISPKEHRQHYYYKIMDLKF